MNRAGVGRHHHGEPPFGLAAGVFYDSPLPQKRPGQKVESLLESAGYELPIPIQWFIYDNLAAGRSAATGRTRHLDPTVQEG